MKFGIKDIAKEANVSLTTVSLVLNNKISRISETKKKEIKQIAEDNDYRPNSAAVALSTHISYNIALIVPDITNPFFAKLIKVIIKKLNEKKYNVLIFDSNNSYNDEKSAIKSSISTGTDGFLLIPSNELFSIEVIEFNELFSNIDKPLVLLNAYTDKKISYVNFDNIKGAELATQELIDHGHKKIAFIKGHDHFVNAIERYQGYQNILLKNKIRFDKNLIFSGDYSIQSGYDIAPNILNNPNITAIVSSNDLMLFGIIKWAKVNQVNISNKISMVGFDNNPYDEILELPLTTIDQDTEKMATKAIKMLLHKIQHPSTKVEHVVIDPILIQRESVHDLIKY
ncbi:LacI family DNA-binding transcriptional regulator [Dellaglioa sp. L3N]